MDDIKIRAYKILEKFNIDSLNLEIRKIEAESSHPDFWKDAETAANKMRRLAVLQDELEKLGKLRDYVQQDEIKDDGKVEIEQIVSELESKLYLSGPYDHFSAIVSIHSGQGGVEAMDWVQMLYRMYTMFCKERGWEFWEIEYEPGTEAGIKTVTFEVKGDSVYGFLKYEAGAHRLVRQSPFNADHLRQTSFALVEVMPVVPETGSQTIEIRDEDLEWDFFRSGGHGGQNVNKVSSAVRVKHIPSGIVVACQKERDQSRNRQIALNVLRSKLLAIEEEKVRQEEARLRGKYLTPGWGNQIRSYVLHPYHMVKDLRTDYEESDTDAILNGHLDNFIQSELHFFANGRDI